MPLQVALIDDDASVSRSVWRRLRLSGMDAVAFPSAESFLEFPARRAFDYLILDIHLEGGLSGLELKEYLNEEGSRIPVIFFSAHDDETTRAGTQRVGCHALLRKGDGTKSLLNALEEVERLRSNSGS